MPRNIRRALPDERWLEAVPVEHRRAMRNYGVPPESHPRAEDFNRRFLQLAQSGLRGMDLAIAAGKLHDEVLGHDLTHAANAAHLADLKVVNSAGGIEQLAYVAVDHDLDALACVIGDSDRDYVVRSLDFVVDALKSVIPGYEPTGLVPFPAASSAHHRTAR